MNFKKKPKGLIQIQTSIDWCCWWSALGVAQCRFLTAPSACPSPSHQAEQRMGRIIRGSDCHSEPLDPLLRGRTERFGGGLGQSDPCRVGLSQYVNVCGTKRYSVGWCRSKCQCLNKGWPNHHGTVCPKPKKNYLCTVVNNEKMAFKFKCLGEFDAFSIILLERFYITWFYL